MPDIEHIKTFFTENDRYAKHSGIRLVEAEPGRAVAEMDVKEFHLNSVGVVHGGAMFTLADFAFAVASNSHGQMSLAVNITMNFVKAATGGTLRAVCEKVADGKLAAYQATVTEESGDVVATFQGLAFRKNQKLPIERD